MSTTCKSLTELTAADVMTRDVIALPKHLSLRAAARLLAKTHISGAPVVDQTGCCVGVLSTTDFVEWAGSEEGSHAEHNDPSPSVCEWEIITAKVPPEDEVHDWMTRDVVTAPPTASVSELARSMIDAHVHRVIVAEGDGRPIGIVSTTDILAAVAKAGE